MFTSFVKNSLVPAVFGKIPFGLLQDLTSVVPLVPYYHVVSNEDVLHIKHLCPFKNVRQFRMDLDAFLKFYTPIDLRDLVSCFRAARPIPKNSFLLSFDDGYREQFDVVAPILLEKGATASFFITTEFLDNAGMAHSNKASLLIERLQRTVTGTQSKTILAILAAQGIMDTDLRSALLSVTYCKRDILDDVAHALDYDFSDYLQKVRPYLTTEQVKKLIGTGFTIGAHSLDHPQYSLISHDEQLHQTLASVRFVRERFCLDYGAFTFPNGDDNCLDAFFTEVFARGAVDVTFGNVGSMKKIPHRHFSRLTMDNQPGLPRSVIGRFYAKSLYDLGTGKRLTGRRNFSVI
jgi:peptidoglycan/xylan/chitin deacetylase (PgdA/CDA1 family)